jgi:hypothetical protein
MATKLTLRIDEHLIEVAKRHAAARETSVSRMVAAYFAALDVLSSSGDVPDDFPAPSPRVRALVGVLPLESDPEAAYQAYISRKHS